MILLAFTLGTEYLAKGVEPGRGIPLPLSWVSPITPMAGQMRVAARWMLPAALGLALLLGYGWYVLWGATGTRQAARPPAGEYVWPWPDGYAWRH